MKYEQTCEMCLKKMFKMVGLEYPNEITKNPEWFTTHTWTKEQQDKFRGWMKKTLKRRHPELSSPRIISEVGWFLLMWGWKNEG